jgi:hypothetical protein
MTPAPRKLRKCLPSMLARAAGSDHIDTVRNHANPDSDPGLFAGADLH